MSCNCELLICGCNKTPDEKSNYIMLKKLPWDFLTQISLQSCPIYWRQYIIFPNHLEIWFYDINNDNYIKKTTCPSEYSYGYFYCMLDRKQNTLYCIGKENYFATYDLIHEKWSTVCHGSEKDNLKSIQMNFPSLSNICNTLSVNLSTTHTTDQLYVFCTAKNDLNFIQYKYDINQQKFIHLGTNSFGSTVCIRLLIYMKQLQQFVLVISCYETTRLEFGRRHYSFDHIYISKSANPFQWTHVFKFPVENKTGPYANWKETNVVYMQYKTFILMYQCDEKVLWCYDLKKSKLCKIGNDNHKMQMLKNTQFILHPVTKYLHYLDGNLHKKTRLSNLIVFLFSEMLVFGYVKESKVEIPKYLTQLITAYFSDFNLS